MSTENEQLKAEIVILKEEQSKHETLRAMNQSFGNVLATIHGDGGHYVSKYGHVKASKDAIKIILQLQTEIARLTTITCNKTEDKWAIYLEGRLKCTEDRLEKLWNATEFIVTRHNDFKYKQLGVALIQLGNLVENSMKDGE